jgi:hypothetical protein
MEDSLRSRRRRSGLEVLAVALSLLAGACTGGGRHDTPRGMGAPPAAMRPAGAAAGTVLVASLAPWRLPAPLSRAVALPDGGGVLLLGGLDRSGASSRQVLRLDLARGTASPAGRLAAPVHDAAGALLGGRAFVFGGGARQTVADVQAVVLGGAAALAGRLPAPRSDLAAVTVAGRAYLVGGYDGQAPSRAVLATGDGTRFRAIALLPQGVRYPAVAADGRIVYVFGGEPAAGGESRAIQAIDLRSGAARIVGQLPKGLAHAAAFRLGGRIYLAGGRSGGRATDTLWRFDPAAGRAIPAGRLPASISDAAVAVAGGAAWLLGGEDADQLATVTVLRPNAGPTRTAPADVAFQGRLLIADRGNDRLLLVDAAKHVLWRYPSAASPAPPGGFFYPDDAFFVRHGTAIISNQEGNETIVEIAFPSGRLLWRYGHPRVAGSGPGYLHEPDDAYLLRDGRVVVADARNCRVLLIGPHSTSQIGGSGRCAHDPPRGLGAPNGDTPLADGNLLVSEIRGSWIDEITLAGRLVWSVHLPIAYPSDPQQLGPDLYLVADYTRPGGIVEFTREGRIVWVYRPQGGEAMLDHPSLAERLPNGRICVNDDYRHRVVVIDPATRRIVWQYGRTDRPGTAPGLLDTPDGFDLLLPGGATPTHPQTG